MTKGIWLLDIFGAVRWGNHHCFYCWCKRADRPFAAYLHSQYGSSICEIFFIADGGDLMLLVVFIDEITKAKMLLLNAV